VVSGGAGAAGGNGTYSWRSPCSPRSPFLVLGDVGVTLLAWYGMGADGMSEDAGAAGDTTELSFAVSVGAPPGCSDEVAPAVSAALSALTAFTP